MLDHLQEGDVVTVWKLDRLARSTRNLFEMVETIRQAAVLDILIRGKQQPQRGLDQRKRRNTQSIFRLAQRKLLSRR